MENSLTCVTTAPLGSLLASRHISFMLQISLELEFICEIFCLVNKSNQFKLIELM